MNRIQVLNAIWSRSTGDKVFLPRLQKGVWRESDALSVTEATSRLPFLAATDGDWYFTPLLYNGSRKRGNVGRPGVIFADLDGDHSEPDMTPSVLIESSPGHFHGYWFLDEPADPAEWEPYAKGWSQWIGADPAGWDLTQVLRVPGSLNHKMDPPAKVTVVRYNVEAVYKLDQFPQAIIATPESAEDVPDADRSVNAGLLKQNVTNGRLPLSTIYWLTTDVEGLKVLGTIDRSAIMWQMERLLFEAGFDAYDVFQLIRFAGINKHIGNDPKLWAEILKAQNHKA